MDKLIEWTKAERGRLKKLADLCGISHSAVWQWKTVPHEHLRRVSDFTGIPMAELRPDLAALFADDPEGPPRPQRAGERKSRRAPVTKEGAA